MKNIKGHVTQKSSNFYKNFIIYPKRFYQLFESIFHELIEVSVPASRFMIESLFLYKEIVNFILLTCVREYTYIVISHVILCSYHDG